MKKTIRFIVLIVVFLVLLGVFFGLQKYNESQKDIVKESKITVADVKKEDIIRISYDYEGETHSLEKEGDTWYYTSDHSLELTQFFISNMAGILAPLTAQQSIEDVEDMAQYGLTEDVRTIRFETETESFTFEVGSHNAISDVYYMRKPSETTVYVIPSVTVAAFNKSLEDLTVATEETTE